MKMPPTFLIFVWLFFGLPSLIAGFVLGIIAVYGRRLWRLRRRRVFVRKRAVRRDTAPSRPIV
jgi:hypothetical protein